LRGRLALVAQAKRVGVYVEMAPVAPGVAVRDSKDPDGPVLLFSPAAWTAFAATPPHA
jgi:hypothetical protein